ncbi:MAG: hypothetical protein R2849_20195 [Thermomicrobiales bacterium]
MLVLLTGCTTETVGMQAPVAHDYDGLEWRPLGGEVSQRMIVAPGYTSLVENDPGTSPEVLQERIARLPEDVRQSTLREIRIAMRTGDDLAFDRQVRIEIANIDRPGEVLALTLDDLRFDGDWAILSEVPDATAGQTIEVRLLAADGWEYGIAVDRIPYGGYSAMVGPVGADRQRLGGALGFQTLFDQQTDVGEILSDEVGGAVGAAITDPVLIALYGIILIIGGGLWFRRLRTREVA